jgi:hypothetical protein
MLRVQNTVYVISFLQETEEKNMKPEPADPARLNAEKRDATGGKASAFSPTMTQSKPSFFSAVRSFSKTS